MTIEELKLFLPDYMKEKGIDLNREGLTLCINPEHNDTHPSMSYDKRRNILHCFACGKTYDIFTLVMQLENLKTFKDALAYLNNKYGGEPLPSDFKGNLSKIPNLEESIRSLDDINAIQYLKEERGFLNSEKVCSIARVKSSDDFIIFPHWHFISSGANRDTYTITDYQARYFNAKDKKNRYKRKGKTSIYEPMAVLTLPYQAPNNIVICEGEIDSLSIWDIKLDEDSKEQLKTLFSIALSGVANTPLLEKKLSSIPEQRRGDYHFLIALDDDKSGQEQAKQVEEILERLSFSYSTFSLLDYGEKHYHDINEVLQEDRQALKDALLKYINEFPSLEKEEKSLQEKERELYFSRNTSKTHLKALLSDFSNKLDNLSINTNFELLNALFTGMTKGVITLGALSSLGKTTFLLQLADQLASNQDRDIIYFSLEQSGKELVSKSLSRFTFLNAKKMRYNTTKAKYSNTILATKLDEKGLYYSDSEENILMMRAINQYDTIANNLFIVEPSGDKLFLTIEDIEEVIKKHISITGKTPIVFIDYLQIIAPKDTRLSDKQAVDINISTLRKIASIYNTLVFAISSISRANYYTPVDINSFKESGAIEYGSDILLGINFTAIDDEDIQKAIDKQKTQEIKKMLKEEKDKSPRNVFIEVLKNRNGKSGERFYFHYYPEFNTFIELDRKEGSEYTALLFKKLDDIENSIEDELPF